MGSVFRWLLIAMTVLVLALILNGCGPFIVEDHRVTVVGVPDQQVAAEMYEGAGSVDIDS